MDILSLATNIYKSEDGIWKTSDSEKISYTEKGHTLIKESEIKSFWFYHRLKCFSIIFKNYPVNFVLDIGGGNGRVSKFLQSIDVEPVLIEPRAEGAYNAIQIGVRNVVHGSLFSAGIKSSSVPAVAIFDVLEHIEDDEKFLHELNRILEPGGKLFLSVPAYQFLYSGFDEEVGHFRRYTHRDLKRKLNTCGFVINYSTYFFSILPLAIFIVRLFYKIIKARKKRREIGHINKKSVFGSIIKVLFAPEFFFIKRNMRIPFGSSCLVVANKRYQNGK